MILDPFERFLGVPRDADPLTILGLTADCASPTEVEMALRRRIANLYAHPDGRSAEADVVRRGLRAAADALRDPAQRSRWIGSGSASAGPARSAIPRAVQLTEFDRSAMAVLVGCGGWNAASRSRLVSLAAAHGVTVQGLQRVITGLSEYAKGHGPRIGVQEITAGAPLPDSMMPGSATRPTYVDRVVAQVGTELRGESPFATIRVALLFGLLTLVAGIVALIMIFRGTDVPPDPGEDELSEAPQMRQIPAAAVPAAPVSEPSPIRPAQFADPPTFQGEVLPALAVEAADRSPSLLRQLDEIGRKLEVSDGEVSDAVYRSWDDALATLSSGWVLLDEGFQHDIEQKILAVLVVADKWPQVTERLLSPMMPTSARWVEPIDIWRNAWRAGINGRIAADTSLPPLLLDQVRQILGIVFDPITANDLPRTFDAAAGVWLDRGIPVLINGLELDPDTYDAWEMWLAARRRVANDEQFNTALIDAVTVILETQTDLSQAGPSRNVLGRLLLSADFLTSVQVRDGILALFGQEQIDAHDLWLLTSLLAYLDSAPWFSAELVLRDDASMPQRSRIRDRIGAQWPAIELETKSASGTGLAVDPEAAQRWVDLAGQVLSEPPSPDPERLMEQLVQACAINEAASLIATEHPVEAMVLMDRLADLGGAVAVNRPKAGAVGQSIGQDGAWATTYKTLGRNVDERMSALSGLGDTAGTDLGPSDAQMLVREAYRGTPQEIRDQARSIVLELFKNGPDVAIELLDQFPDAPTTDNVSTFLSAVTGETLPSARSETWAINVRRALVAHALTLRYLGRQKIDDMALAVAGCYESQRRALTGADPIGGAATRPEVAAEQLFDAWVVLAESLIATDPVPDDLAGIQRRLAIRSRLVDGAMQEFAARQAALLDVLAYVTVAEQPVLAQEVRRILSTSAAARAAAHDILVQALVTERSAFPLWRLRMSIEGDGATRSAAIPLVVALALAGLQDSSVDAYEDRLTGLGPEDPRAYFLLAEEIADVAANDELLLDLARQLFGLAGVLNTQELGRSACLALADLAEDDIERRRLLALGWLIDDRSAATGPRNRLAQPSSDMDSAMALSEAFSYYRRGQGSRALAALRRGGATELLETHEDLLRGGAQRFIEDCKLYRGPLRPTLSDSDITRMLQLELALLSDTQRSWSSQMLLSRGRPLIEVDPEKLPETLGVDVSRPYYRDGRWVPADQ